MQKVNIETNQNVLLSYEIATIGDRILAWIIDALILVAVIISISLLLDDSNSWIIDVVNGLVLLLYHFLFELFNNGQSPGKQQMKIRVAMMDGGQPTVVAYLLRWILRPFDVTIPIIGILFITMGGKGQRLGDIAAGTTVIKVKEKVGHLKKASLSKMDPNYKPVFPEAASMSVKEVELILHALKHYRETSNNKPVMAIYYKMIEILKVQPNMEPVAFLHTLVKDYNHFATHG